MTGCADSQGLFGRRSLLAGSVSLLALATGCLAGINEASAQSPLRNTSIGENGRSAVIRLFGSNDTARPGRDGGDIKDSKTVQTPDAGSRGTFVEIGSAGGRGGDGSSYGFSELPAQYGGKGGDVSYELMGQIVGKASQATGVPLISIYSRGGNGGGANSRIGRGGDSGDVTLELRASVRTDGANFAGAWVRSVGGNAGYGGTTEDRIAIDTGGRNGKVDVTLVKGYSITTTGANAVGFIGEAVGGTGSTRGSGTFYSEPFVTNGATGGDVFIKASGSIETKGVNSAAMLAQSAGGAGGSQGDSGGRPGAKGGLGGGVEVDLKASSAIKTNGSYSFGLIAQSLGGSGGSGGGAVFSGGDGGAAGAGGRVTVTNAGRVESAGKGAHGIVAQSVGGGNALNAFQLADIRPSGGGGAGGTGGVFFFGRGGGGGTGGDGGRVEIYQDGRIQTGGESAFGILAQSVGGGGGAGGNATAYGAFVGIALGGRGGGGGNGGDVLISSHYNGSGVLPSIETAGNSAKGILAQSVGGSGGAGGSASATTVGLDVAVSVAVGGAGGKGGSGGDVTVKNASSIQTAGLEASGIEAKSVGGGGGTAGNASAYALAVSPPGHPTINVTYTVGGTGGDGGSGGSVTLINSAPVLTGGSQSVGLKGKSVGGGGGSGGVATSVSDLIGFYKNIGVSVALGGTAGGGGAGGIVEVTNRSSVETKGAFSNALTAMSVGGGGGEGGLANTSAKAGLSWNDYLNSAVGLLPMADALTVNVTLGGKGGGGGSGNSVTATNNGSLQTSGTDARGIFAQSIGGGGGIAGGFLGKGEGTASASFSLGASGGNGGSGGRVEVNNNAGATVSTLESGSTGIFAQSIGGGGGDGGSFTGKTKTPVQREKAPIAFMTQVVDELLSANSQLSGEFGDKSKAWEDAGFFDKNSDVQKTLTQVKTFMKAWKSLIDDKKSLTMRLIDTGFYTALGAAKLAFKDDIKKAFKAASPKYVRELKNFSIKATLGGSGGTGGNGGVVVVTNDGRVETKGYASFGIFAQSIGGGGGTGGASTSNGTSNYNYNLSIGGGGASGGKGGTVTATNNGTISTTGAASFGLVGQSVGGGGGLGGAATSANSISVSANVNVGGSGGNNSDGGQVTVKNTGKITTSGREAHALVAQSVGGGGGISMMSRVDLDDSYVVAVSKDEQEALAATLEVIDSLDAQAGGSFNAETTILPSIGGTLDYGGSGGTGGQGNTVIVNHSGQISTTGAAAIGILAQSIGGGGGFGANSSKSGWLQMGIGLGGAGGAAGNGGEIQLNLGNGSSVSTTGDGSTAIMLQSIGGGGGYGGATEFRLAVPATLEYIRDDATSGNGNTISVNMSTEGAQASISTSGARAHGLFAQSIGGGGGAVTGVNGANIKLSSKGKGRDRAKGIGGAINVDTAGIIAATGEGAYGVFLQSGVQQKDGALDVNRKGSAIRLKHKGVIAGGTGDGAAIRIDGGAENAITIRGGSRISASSGMAVLGSFGQEKVTNEGVIVGSLDLSLGGKNEWNELVNKPGAALDLSNDRFVRLGSGQLVNSGIVIVSTEGAGTATIEGKFKQEKAGMLAIGIDQASLSQAPRSGKLTIKGKAEVQGALVPTITALLPDTYNVLSARDGLTFTGAVGGIGSYVVPIQWKTSQTGTDLSITPVTDFTSTSGGQLTPNQLEAAQHLQENWTSRSFAQAPLFAQILNLSSSYDYQRALDALSTEDVGSAATGQTRQSFAALGAVMSCPAFQGAGIELREGNCVWGRIGASRVSQFSSLHSDGYKIDGLNYRIGYQNEFMTNWFAGFSAAYSDSSQSVTGRSSSTDGQSADVSVALKHQIGNWLFALSGTAGYGWYDHKRLNQFGTSSWTASSYSNVFTAGAKLRASYEVPLGNWYIRPFADVDVMYSHVPSYAELGPYGFNVESMGMHEMTFAFSPNVEFGGRVDLNASTWLRPYATLGITFLSDDELRNTAKLGGSALSASAYDVSTPMPDLLGDASAGLQIYNANGIELKAEYRAQFGEKYLSQEGTARLAIHF